MSPLKGASLVTLKTSLFLVPVAISAVNSLLYALSPNTDPYEHLHRFQRLRDAEKGFSTKSVRDASIVVSFTYTWTNVTFAEAVCNQVDSIGGAEPVTKVEIVRGDPDGSLPYNEYFLMPDCFWTLNLASLNRLYADHTIFTGSSAAGEEADPLLRFPSSLTRIQLYHSRLVNPSVRGATYKINWTTFWPSKPQLARLTLDDVKLEGALPAVLPDHISLLIVRSNPKFAGTIPAGLFSNYSETNPNSLDVIVSGNGITGTIPNTLFANFKKEINPTFVSFIFDSNALTGTVPPGLFSNTSWGGSFVISFSGNQLTGTLPANIFGTDFWGTSFNETDQIASVSLDLSSNKLSGTIPETLFSGTSTSMGAVELLLSDNAFTGSIPNFFANVNSSLQIGALYLSLGENQLSGTILPSKLWPPASMKTTTLEWNIEANSLTSTVPETLFSGADESLVSILIDLSENKLTGSLQARLLTNARFSKLIELSLSLRKNAITGPLTTAFVGAGSQIAFHFSLDLSGNPLGGTIPSNLLSSYSSDRSSQNTTDLDLRFDSCGLSGTLPSLVNNLDGFTLSLLGNALSAVPTTWSTWLTSGLDNTVLVLDLSNNKFTGVLTLPSLDPSTELLLSADANDFTSIAFGDQITYLAALSVALNPRMTGTLPAALFDGTSSTYYLNVNHTLISGGLPVLNGYTNLDLQWLYLSDTSINFCPSTLTSWDASKLRVCDLQNEKVACIAKYPGACQYYYGRALDSGPKAPTSSAHFSATPTTATLAFALMSAIFALL